MYIYASFVDNTFDVYQRVFLLLLHFLLVEWYVNDMDRSQGSAGVFDVHSLFRIPSLCQTLPVILREELSIN